MKREEMVVGNLVKVTKALPWCSTIGIPAGRGEVGEIVYTGDAITVNFHNVLVGKYSISHSVAETHLERCSKK